MTVDAATVGRGSAPTANPVELVVAGAAGRMGEANRETLRGILKSYALVK